MDLRWYARRLASMSPREILSRLDDRIRQERWKRKLPAPPRQAANGTTLVRPVADVAAPDAATSSLIASADALLAGSWPLFGSIRSDATANLDYYLDPATGRSAPSSPFFATIDHRNEDLVGNIKFVWEHARLQHLTMLASAYRVTSDDRYAERVVQELAHFRKSTPFPKGIHWTSGIEIGIRLISWVWIRRLLDAWPGVAAHFEDNADFRDHLGRHHQWLASFHSQGSSANNHLIAELCGHYVAATMFDLFDESPRWRRDAGNLLTEALENQTFADGLNKELASDYHAFVLELSLSALIEAVASGDRIAQPLSGTIGRSLDALAAVVDRSGGLHHQGDSDDAHGFLLDPVSYDRVADLLAVGTAVVGSSNWWPDLGPGSVRAALVRGLLGDADPILRTHQESRPNHFPDAGLTFLRSPAGSSREIWVRFDHGALGYLATAAHGHADALAVEVRHGGVPVLVDPGTYCYHGERVWRDYFRSTAAHNTIALGGCDQSEMGGPFLWLKRANSSLVSVEADRCEATHDGFLDHFGTTHRRIVGLNNASRRLSITDSLECTSTIAGPATINFHFGPTVRVTLGDDVAELDWIAPDGSDCSARLELATGPHWSLHSGETDPPLGWLSPVFGTKVPITTLVGHFDTSMISILQTTLTFRDVGPDGSSETTAAKPSLPGDP